MRRLLTIGHSYVVALNRQLAHEMAVQGGGAWEVTAIAPSWLAGDLRAITLEQIEGEACRVASLPVRLDSMPHLRHYAGGLRDVMRQPWDVVHCWEEPYVAAGFQVARNTPAASAFVFATFQNIVKRYPPPLRWFEQRVLSRANGWIAFGETVHRAQAHREGYAALPSRAIPPGVDVERFAPDAAARERVHARFGWDEKTPVAGFLGRFVDAKGIRLLTDVLPRVRHPWRALFVGNGPLRSHLEAFAAAHRGRVVIASDVAHGQVPDYLNAMDVLCAPSETTATWREQFGRMTIEAMACGVPVIGSDSGEIPHVAGGGGVIVAERDRDAWVAAIGALLEDPDRRRALAAAGRERAVARFAWPVVARRHLDFFDELLAGGVR